MLTYPYYGTNPISRPRVKHARAFVIARGLFDSLMDSSVRLRVWRSYSMLDIGGTDPEELTCMVRISKPLAYTSKLFDQI